METSRQLSSLNMARLICCIFPALVLGVFLSGCMTSSSTLYSWGNYESLVYAYLNGESREQIQVMERDLERIEASGRIAAPGFYAHLGLLYAEAGDDVNAVACFETEKNHFPEAGPYMDFLLKKFE